MNARSLFVASKKVLAATIENRVTGLASEVAFFGVFSLFPALLIAAGLLGQLDALLGWSLAQEVEAKVVAALGQVLTERAAPVTNSVHALFGRRTSGLITSGALLAAWSVSSGVDALIDSLDIIYRVKAPRSWLKQRLWAVGLGLGSVVMLSLVLSLLVVIPLLDDSWMLEGVLGLGSVFVAVWKAARMPLALVVLVIWTATVLHIGPNRKSRWRDDLPGAVVTAVLAVAVTVGLRVYLRFAIEGNPVLGLLGGGLILMLWFYVLSVTLLVGAQVNAVRAGLGPGPSRTGDAP